MLLGAFERRGTARRVTVVLLTLEWRTSCPCRCDTPYPSEHENARFYVRFLTSAFLRKGEESFACERMRVVLPGAFECRGGALRHRRVAVVPLPSEWWTSCHCCCDTPCETVRSGAVPFFRNDSACVCRAHRRVVSEQSLGEELSLLFRGVFVRRVRGE